MLRTGVATESPSPCFDGVFVSADDFAAPSAVPAPYHRPGMGRSGQQIGAGAKAPACAR